MKNVIKSFALALLLVLGIMLESCTTDPGLASVNMEMKASTTLSSIGTGGRTASTGMTFVEARVGVTEIELETKEENEAEDKGEVEDHDGDGEDDNEEIEFEGEFTVDLITGTSTPDFGGADIAPGIYEEIEINMDPIMDDGNTIFMAFDYAPNAVRPVRFEFAYDKSLEFELESDAGIELTDTGLNQLLVIIDLDSLFANVNLDVATADADGIYRINSQSNMDIYNQIVANLDAAMKGGEDDDDDGELDDD